MWPCPSVRDSRPDMKGGISIDILVLVDRLEELLKQSPRVPMTGRTMVDEQAFLNIIDQMRITIPEEIRQAKRVLDERDRLTAQAQEEAERTLAAAQEKAAFLLDSRGLSRAAEDRAQAIIAEAQARADKLRADADEYCLSVMRGLEQELSSLLTTARNGIQLLQTSMSSSKPKREKK